jgi:DNA-binding NarL/FixJ family response regulator
MWAVEQYLMRVLLADDQVWLRSALRLFLEHEAACKVVGEVTNAQELPGSTAALHPDLILLDWELPGLNTDNARQRLIAALRAICPHLYIIVLGSDELRNNQPIVAGADAWFSRAEPPDRLQAVLHRAVATSEGHIVSPSASL